MAEVRGNRARLNYRMDALESRFDILETRFDGLKVAMQQVLESQGLFMAKVKVSIRWKLAHSFLTSYYYCGRILMGETHKHCWSSPLGSDSFC